MRQERDRDRCNKKGVERDGTRKGWREMGQERDGERDVIRKR